jgi:hypothetical protein
MKTILIGLLSGTLSLALGVASAQTNGNAAQATAPGGSNQGQTQPQATPASTPEAMSPQPTPSRSAAPTAATAPAGKVTRVAAGSVIPISLVKTIDAKKAKSGDEVVGKVTQDLKTNSGELILAKDTKVMGHVTEAQARSKEQKESQLAVLFDHAVTKNSGDMNMPMSIQAVIGSQSDRAQNDNAQNGETSGNQSTERSSDSMPSSGRSGISGASSSAAPTSSAETNSSTPSPANHSSHPPITAQTQGVIGISGLNLAPADASKGSVFTSEKSNVKIESGTMMLLRVN